MPQTETATDYALEVLRKHGCPLHSSLVYKIAQEVYGYLGNESAIIRQLNRLAKRGTIRALRPGVFSAFGPERD